MILIFITYEVYTSKQCYLIVGMSKQPKYLHNSDTNQREHVIDGYKFSVIR